MTNKVFSKTSKDKHKRYRPSNNHHIKEEELYRLSSWGLGIKWVNLEDFLEVMKK